MKERTEAVDAAAAYENAAAAAAAATDPEEKKRLQAEADTLKAVADKERLEAEEAEAQ